MDVSRPFAALAPGVESDVLVALAGSTAQRSGREIARLSRRSSTGVQHALDRLVDEGLVHRIPAGRAYLYSLNHDHLLAPAVGVMAGARWELVRRLRDLFSGWKLPILHASLFGSVARGEGNAASDIDLLVVRPNGIDVEDEQWRGQLEQLADRVLRWTGNQAGIAELSEDDVSAPTNRPPIFEEVAEEAIDLGGLPLRSLIKKP